jgi:hypothetical protein
MRRIREIQNPDGLLTYILAEGADGQMFATFKGSSWHIHSDGISAWLNVPEAEAFNEFERLLTSNGLPIIISTDAGVTVDPWVSDNLEATIEIYGAENCALWLWSGDTYNEGQA